MSQLMSPGLPRGGIDGHHAVGPHHQPHYPEALVSARNRKSTSGGIRSRRGGDNGSFGRSVRGYRERSAAVPAGGDAQTQDSRETRQASRAPSESGGAAGRHQASPGVAPPRMSDHFGPARVPRGEALDAASIHGANLQGGSVAEVDPPRPPRPTTPCISRGEGPPLLAVARPPTRPVTPGKARNPGACLGVGGDGTSWCGPAHGNVEKPAVLSGAPSREAGSDAPHCGFIELPPRPTTPGPAHGSRKHKRTSSAGASGRQNSRSARPGSGSVGARISELESALLARRHQAAMPDGVVGMQSDARSGRTSALGMAAEDAGFSREGGVGEEPQPLPPPPPRPSTPLGKAAGAASVPRPCSSSGRRVESGPQPRPSSSLAHASGAYTLSVQPASLIEEAMAMCRGARASLSTAASGATAPVALAPRATEAAGALGSPARMIPAAAAVTTGAVDDATGSSPRHSMERPLAPTPEQTSHWLQGLEGPQAEVAADENSAVAGSPVVAPVGVAGGCGPARPCSAAGAAQGSMQPLTAKRYGVAFAGYAGESCAEAASSSRSPTPDGRRVAPLRPRSPTPTKMLAWEEEDANARAKVGSGPVDLRISPGDSDIEGRGDHTDGLIAKLIQACQMNEVNKAFVQYEKLHRMRIPLYEGVYKLIIECCMRTQQLGHAMHFYETLKSSGQRISSRLVILLMEACAREQHGDKVHAIWKDWCPAHEALTQQKIEVLLVCISALIRTMSPDLARDALSDALARVEGSFASCFAHAEVDVEELLLLNESVADEARASGTLLGDLARRFEELHVTLESLRRSCMSSSPNRARRCDGTNGSDGLRRFEDSMLMEDVDLDLELAAR